jgi:hypothetical protein
MREVKSVHSILEDHESRLKAVEVYKTSQEAVANYVAKYGTREQKESSSNSATVDINKDLLALMTKIIGVVATLGTVLYVLANRSSL